MDLFRSTWQWATGETTPAPIAPVPTTSNAQSQDSQYWGWEGASTHSDLAVSPPSKVPEDGSFGSTLWSLLSSKLGADVISSGISLPSWMYEPLSILQRQAEMIQHAEVLNKAAECEDELIQLAYVAGFAVSAYSSTQRFKPSFNPMLGETYEFIDKKNGVKFFAEQVSHHPPVSAFHSENEGLWTFWQNSSPTTKFLGNSLDLHTNGNSHIYFNKTKNHFFYTNPWTRVHNIVFGTMWIEHYGELRISSLSGNYSCLVVFRQGGYFQGAQFEIEGFITDKIGKKIVLLKGRWDTYLKGKWLVDTPNVKTGTIITLWKYVPEPFVVPAYNFMPFAASLNDIDPLMQKVLPPTDSRFRLDRLFLEKGDFDTSTQWKKIMEETQRQDRRNRNTDKWTPVWFCPSDRETDKNLWIYCGDYWKQREKKENLVKEGKDPEDLLYPPQIRGLACDFLHTYQTNK